MYIYPQLANLYWPLLRKLKPIMTTRPTVAYIKPLMMAVPILANSQSRVMHTYRIQIQSDG